ncbi:unnamed protein product, partial [Vitis vinifera]
MKRNKRCFYFIDQTVAKWLCVTVLVTSNMSTDYSACSPAPDANPETNRRTANFNPSTWGNSFIMTNSPDDEITLAHKEQQLEDLKEEVRRELKAAAGFNISCDIFNRYTDEKGRFKESLINDACGLLGLYEAAHLRVWEEDILDEALAFATTHLESIMEHLEHPLATQEIYTLIEQSRPTFPISLARFFEFGENLLKFNQMVINPINYDNKMNRFKASCLLAEHCKGRQYTKGNLPLVIEKIIINLFIWDIEKRKSLIMLFRKYLTQRILKYSQRLFRKYNNSLTLLTLVQNFDSNDFEIKRNMLLTEKFNHASVFSLLNNPGLILMTSITISKPIFSYRHVFLFLLFLSINSILNKFTTQKLFKMFYQE